MASPEKEVSNSSESLKDSESSKNLDSQKLEILKNIETKAENSEASKAAEMIARKKVEQEAADSIEGAGENEKAHSEKRDENWSNLGKSAKTTSFKHSMQKVQSQMTPVSRSFSRFIHNPAVEVISDATAKTIARPSSLMGAGIMGLIGITMITYLAKHSGFSLSGSELPFLMIGGAFIGVLSEFTIKLVRKLSN